QDHPEEPPQRPVHPRPAIGLFDMTSRMIDEMHVVHARRAGGHARQAGEAAVDMLGHLLRRRPVVLEHVLDEVDASARAVELIAQQRIGRAGGGAEAAVDAGAEDLLGFPRVRIGEQRLGKIRLHRVYRPFHMRPGFRMPAGSKPCLIRPWSASKALLAGSNTGTSARTLSSAATSVAWPPTRATAARMIAAPPSRPASSASTFSQTSPPPQSSSASAE